MFLLVASTREELGDLPGHPLGIGAILVAARMATLIERLRPAGVVMIGTGGGYRDGPAIGQVVSARRVGFSPGVAAMGLGYVPRAPRPIDCDLSLLQGLGLPEVDVLTVSAVTTDPILADRLADGWSVEHIECYGAAAACATAGIPFAAALGIATQAGPEAHTQWLSNRTLAQQNVRSKVAELLNRSSRSVRK